MATALGRYLSPYPVVHAHCLGSVDGNGNAFLSCSGQSVRSPVVLCNSSRQRLHFTVPGQRLADTEQRSGVQSEAIFDDDDTTIIHVQTLRSFPKEKLRGELVAVRVDPTLLLAASCDEDGSVNKALYTIKYLRSAGAKVILLSSWNDSGEPILTSAGTFAEYLSLILKLTVLPVNVGQLNIEDYRRADIFLFENLTRIKGEVANSLDFSKKLSAGAGIFVNDTFSLAHKILASTVGISQFCYSSVAGFHFEEELHYLTSITEATKRPFIAIIGGAKFLEKGPALRLLALKCDGLIFVGKMAFQIMHALGLNVPINLVEYDATEQAFELTLLAKKWNINILFPDDFLCVDNKHPETAAVFSSERIPPGWTPVDLGPVSLESISSRLSKCKKILLLGPMNNKDSGHDVGVCKMSRILQEVGESGCEIIVVGNASYKTNFRGQKHFKNASVVWEFLKGRKLPGISALDRAYPYKLDWNSIFRDPSQPLVVDVGSGNGLFLLGMAKTWQTSNFLGLEINRKLVDRCLDDILQHGMKNIYFLSTNATSTFRSIISSYPGKLILVSIQCPNPDFKKTQHRWRMVQRSLVEAIIELLVTDGKVFLQSDVEEVARRMKDEFMLHGKGTLAANGDGGDGWIEENPFGVRSDWEQHVLDRGAPMYRALLRKVGT